MHVIIVGAGLTGPALAVALARRSIRSTLIERRSAITDIGGVIMLAANAINVLDKVVGVETKLRPKGFSFDAIHLYTLLDQNASLHLAGGAKVDDPRGRGGEGSLALTLSRSTLHETLVDECKEYPRWIDVQFGRTMSRIEEGEDGVSVCFDDGTRLEGDLVIGADGIGSKVRQHILGNASPPSVYSGSVSIGGIVPRSQVDLPDDFPLPAFLYTQAGTILLFSLDADVSALQWATTVITPERERKDWAEYSSSGRAADDAKRQFADIATAEPTIRSLLDGLTAENTKFWAPYSVPDMPTWHSDRCCVLGDAAHAIPPSAGQGAAQGFEDVGLMAMLLSSPAAMEKGGLPRVFEHFERTRKKRMATIRNMTARAESSRGPTRTSWGWWFKRSVISGYLGLMGTKGYVRGGGIMDYDVTKEDIAV